MRCLKIILVLAMALGAVSACAADTSNGREVYIFKGDDPALDGIALGNWGSGSAVRSKEKILDGSWSIKINTQNFYSGGRIDFTRPVTLFKGGIDKSRYIQFTFFFDQVIKVDPARGTDYAWDIEPYTIPKVAKLRFVFESDEGLVTAIEKLTGKIDPDDHWMRVAVPLAKFQVGEKPVDQFRLKRLLVMSDLPTTTYLGEMKLVTDNSKLTVESLDTQTLAIMDDALWVAEAEGGVSSLLYSWDFDAANGIQHESDAMVGRYIYTMGRKDANGNDIPFVVTLTVTDSDGLKAPVTVTAAIEISD